MEPRILTMVIVGLLAAGIIVGCGGGGSNQSSQIKGPTINKDLELGYFMGTPKELPSICGYTDFVMTNDWGDWTTNQNYIVTKAMSMVSQAVACGVKKVIFSIGPLVFTSNYQYKGTTFLYQFKQQLLGSGYYDLIDTFYVLDEPDVYLQKGLTEVSLEHAVQGIREVFPDKKLMTIYSNSGNTPGIALFDYIGRDDYGSGTGVLDNLPPLQTGQRYVLVVGGADPWKADPLPYYEFATQHSEVKYIVFFIAEDYPVGLPNAQKGIITNGMLPKFNQVVQDNQKGIN